MSQTKPGFSLIELGVKALRQHFNKLGVLMTDEDLKEYASIYAIGFTHAYMNFSADFTEEKKATQAICWKLHGQWEIVDGDPLSTPEQKKEAAHKFDLWSARRSAILSLGERIQRSVPMGNNAAQFTDRKVEIIT